jgi:hypothetical protein
LEIRKFGLKVQGPAPDDAAPWEFLEHVDSP